MQAAKQHHIVRLIVASFVILLFVLMFVPFFTPLLLAALFAFAFDNLVTKYTRKFKRSRVLITIGLLISLTLFVATPLVIVTFKSVSVVKEYAAVGLQNTDTYKKTEQVLASVTQSVNSMAQSLDLDLSQLPKVGDLLAKGSQFLATAATTILASIPDLVLALLVFMLSLYYFLTESAEIKTFFIKLDLLTKKEVTEIIDIVKKSSYLTVIASALVGALQAVIVAAVAYFCGFRQFMMIFVMTFIFSLIPVIGAAPIAIILAFLSFVQGNNGIGIVMLVAAAIAGSIDNVVKPLIVNSSGDDELHPVIALLALIGAIIIYGAPGILLGPILTQLAFKIISILFPSSPLTEAVENKP